jgi:hypothetical protein
LLAFSVAAVTAFAAGAAKAVLAAAIASAADDSAVPDRKAAVKILVFTCVPYVSAAVGHGARPPMKGLLIRNLRIAARRESATMRLMSDP